MSLGKKSTQKPQKIVKTALTGISNKAYLLVIGITKIHNASNISTQ